MTELGAKQTDKDWPLADRQVSGLNAEQQTFNRAVEQLIEIPRPTPGPATDRLSLRQARCSMLRIEALGNRLFPAISARSTGTSGTKSTTARSSTAREQQT